jgi:hypothetical protein
MNSNNYWRFPQIPSIETTNENPAGWRIHFPSLANHFDFDANYKSQTVGKMALAQYY